MRIMEGAQHLLLHLSILEQLNRVLTVTILISLSIDVEVHILSSSYRGMASAIHCICSCVRTLLGLQILSV